VGVKTITRLRTYVDQALPFSDSVTATMVSENGRNNTPTLADVTSYGFLTLPSRHRVSCNGSKSRCEHLHCTVTPKLRVQPATVSGTSSTGVRKQHGVVGQMHGFAGTRASVTTAPISTGARVGPTIGGGAVSETQEMAWYARKPKRKFDRRTGE